MTIFEDAKKYIYNAVHLDGCGVYGDGPQDCTCGLDALQALRSLPTDDGWEDIENIKETDGMVLCAGKWQDGIKWRAIGQAFDGYAVGDWDECLEPTHFCPLPDPPSD